MININTKSAQGLWGLNVAMTTCFLPSLKCRLLITSFQRRKVAPSAKRRQPELPHYSRVKIGTVIKAKNDLCIHSSVTVTHDLLNQTSTCLWIMERYIFTVSSAPPYSSQTLDYTVRTVGSANTPLCAGEMAYLTRGQCGKSSKRITECC